MSAPPAPPPPPRLLDLLRADAAAVPATVAIIAVNLAVFAAMLANGAGLWHSPNSVQLAWGAGFGPATKDGEWWRLGSAMFLHFGLLHLALNMLALWDGGRLVERLCGPARYLAIYAAAGLSGNLLSLIAQGDRAVSGGASGAVFGVYGALLVCLWLQRQQVHPVEFRWLFGGAAAFSAANVILGLLIPGIDNAAHIGGLLGGALSGMLLAPAPAALRAATLRRRALAAAIYAGAIAWLIASIPPPAYRWQEELQARQEIRQFLGDDQRIAGRWQEILASGAAGSASFDQIAGRIENEITREYRESFEQLAAVHLDPAAPSTPALNALREYTRLRGDAAQSLADALRKKDTAAIRAALDKAQRAPDEARSLLPPAKAGAAAPAR